MQGCKHKTAVKEYVEVVITSGDVRIDTEVETNVCQHCNKIFYEELQDWI